MKFYLLVLIFLVGSFASDAQRGSTAIGIGAEAGVPLGDFSDAANTGFGGYAKIMFGLRGNAQLTFTTGYSSFSLKGIPTGVHASINILPLMAGLRQNINGFYVEPQLGAAVYTARASYNGTSNSNTETKFTWAAGIGYAQNGIDFGVRYQRGEFEGGNLSLIGFRVGYNFHIGKGGYRRR